MPWALHSMGLMGGRLETRDAALRAHGPSVAARDEAHGVVGAAIEEFPGLAVVAGDIGPGSAGDDPKPAGGQVRDGGTEAFGAGAQGSRPGEAAVGGEDDVLAVFGVLGVIAAYGDAMAGVGEGEGEDAGGRGIGANRGGGDGPGVGAIFGMEQAGGAGASGGEPGVALAEQGERSVAGGERALVGQGGRRGSPLPGGAAVIGGEDLGAAVEWIARDNAVWRIPESDGVEEAFGIGVGEQERPVLAGVAGFIDAGFVAGAGTHQVDGARVDGADAAKIEVFGAGDFGSAPSHSAIGSREQRAAAAAGPYGAGVDRADTAQRGARITGLWRPGLRQEGSGETERERQLHVFTMVSDCRGAAGGSGATIGNAP